MKATLKKPLGILAGISLAFLINQPGTLCAESARIPLSGGWAWDIVPPFSGPGTIIPLPSGGVHLRDVLTSGSFSITGGGVALEATITASINGNLDATLSGPLFGPVALTAVIDGEETIIFEGRFAADSVGLLTEGKVMLHGRGPYAGQTLHYSFVELPELNVYTFEGYLTVPQG